MPRDPGAYADAHPSRAALVVEVAEGSYRVDREAKLGLYARAGIPEYWIVDLARGVLEVHREPGPAPEAPAAWRYRAVVTLEPPAMAMPLAAPGQPIAVADLLP